MERVFGKSISLADDADAVSTGLTCTEGYVVVEYTLAATGAHHSAIFSIYDAAGTPTPALLVGSSSYFTVTNEDAKVRFYWDGTYSVFKIRNRLGTDEVFTVSKIA
jgi:hypothetical protein